MLNIMLFPYRRALAGRRYRLNQAAWIKAAWIKAAWIISFCSFSVAFAPSALATEARSEPIAGQVHTTAPALYKTLQEIKQRHNIPCLSLSWVKDQPAQPGSITLGCDFDAQLRWGSITKTFTALTVLDLVVEGLVDLYAPISAYLDNTLWDNTWHSDQPIRVIDLIELRAGFADLSGQAFNYNEPLQLAEALAFERRQLQTFWPPGLQHAYSNLAPGLSQLLIETVSGQSYAEAVNERVLKPLHFSNASFTQSNNLLPGFKLDGTTPIPYWEMTFAAFGALNASSADMQKLLVELLEPAALHKFQHQHLRNPSGRRFLPQFNFDYAAGFYPRIRRGFSWHNHGGDADGYRSRLSIMADHPRGYVANITSDNPAALREIERTVERFLTAGLSRPDSLPEFNLSQAELQAFTGTYYPSSTRFGVAAWQSGKLRKAAVVLREGQLWFSSAGNDTRLLPVDHNQFRRTNDPLATIAFVQVGKTLYLQGELGHYARLNHCPAFLNC